MMLLAHYKIIEDYKWIYKIEKVIDICFDTYTYQIAVGIDKDRVRAYSVIVDGRCTSHSFETLDEALAFAIAYRNDGINTKAHEYFIKSISPLKK